MNLKNVLESEKIVIYGAGIIAHAVLKVLQENGYDLKNRVMCCAVSSSNHNVKDIDGVPVYAINEVAEKYKDCYYILAVREKYVFDIEKTLDSYGITRYDICSLKECIDSLKYKWKKSAGERAEKFVKNIDKSILSDEDYLMFLSKQLKEKELSFEVNLADHCNLNCQSCNHFSPLALEKFLKLESYERDIERIAKLTQGRVGTLMLLGGEPLLHPQICEIMIASRKNLPNAVISVVSNGLLLPKMNNRFWETCKENNVGLLLTKYPIKFDYSLWEKRALEEGVKLTYTYESTVNKTTYHLPIREDGGLNSYQNYAKCYHANQCVVLRDGRLYTCPLAAYVDYFNKYFNKNIPEKNINSIDIYEEKEFDNIQEFLKRPIPMCNHCDIYNYKYDIPWKTSKKEIKEWT